MNPPSKPPAVDPRIYLAAERTLLAWIRTGIALMGFGLVVAKLRFFLDEFLITRGQPTPVSSGVSVGTGLALLALGVLVIVAAAIRHHRYVSGLARFGPDVPVPRRFPVVLAGILALAGLLLGARVMMTARWLAESAPPAESSGRPDR